MTRSLLLCFSIALSLSLKAQLEFGRMTTKNFTGNGFGSFLNFGIKISEGNSITAEGCFYYFGNTNNNVALAPVLAGFRYTFDGTGTGFYVEPNVGYTFGGSDIVKTDAYGNQITDANGNPIDQKVSGPSAGLSVGYIFPGFPVNLGLRYERIFSNPDPGVNLFTFRATYFLSFGHRDD